MPEAFSTQAEMSLLAGAPGGAAAAGEPPGGGAAVGVEAPRGASAEGGAPVGEQAAMRRMAASAKAKCVDPLNTPPLPARSRLHAGSLAAASPALGHHSRPVAGCTRPGSIQTESSSSGSKTAGIEIY